MLQNFYKRSMYVKTDLYPFKLPI